MNRRLLIVLIVVVTVAGTGAGLFWYTDRSLQKRSLDAFYDGPFELPTNASAGQIIRADSLGTHGGARLSRLIYLSTNEDGSLQPISAMAAIPDRPAPAEGWPLITAAHGTVGNARACAPSLDPLSPVAWPFLPRVLTGHVMSVMKPFTDAGYAVILTDYRGLGVDGAPSFFIGEIEARNVLDAARAMHRSQEPIAALTFVWGHSQGGHSAAFTAEIAPTYAPEAGLAGAILLAPAVQPGPLFEGLYERNQPGPLNGLAMLVVDAWSRVYADTPANTVLAANMLPRLAVAREQCLFGVIDAFQNLVPRDMFLGNPRTIPGWSERIQQNTASIGDLGIPVLVAQGLADGVVDPAVTADYVRQQCAAGNRIQFVTYAGVDHFGVAERSVTDQIRWLQAIRNGETPTTC